jgi:hypothetical protein
LIPDTKSFPKHLDIAGSAQSADQQKRRGGIVMDYFVDTKSVKTLEITVKLLCIKSWW